MGFVPNRRQWKKWSVSSKWAYLSSLISFSAAVIVIIQFFIGGPAVSPDIKQKISELGEIRTALSTLDTYLEEPDRCG